MVYDPRIPERDVCVLGYQVEKWAAKQPDEIAIIFNDGDAWTWTEVLDRTRKAAKGFQDLGVVKGDHVMSWLPNGKEALLTWFGLNYLGAVYVPVNLAYKGSLLEYLIDLSDAKLMVAHADLVPRLADIGLGKVTDLVVVGGDPEVEGVTVHPESVLQPDTGLSGMPSEVDPWDTQYIIFTSGTTGPSKAVLSSYLQGYSMGPWAHSRFTPEDRILINLPMFHVGGTIFLIITLANGGSCYLDTHFKSGEFWQIVRDNEITSACLLAAMVPFLLNLPEFEGEKDHPMKKAVVLPWTGDAVAMSERYGLESWTTFNMTEVSSPLVSEDSPKALGTCGRPRPGIEARVVDENDCEVAPGDVGELILRTDTPWAQNHGYYKNPEATAEAWRNGWFHTGDGFKYDEDGNFFFVDRIKDAIRRRGENISSFEVEGEVSAHPSVKEVAAIPVPSELGEDEVMIVVTPVEGATIDPKELHEFLEPRMAYFALPRYIRIIDALPKTPTEKVRKHLLKEDGITEDTWDREAAGIVVRGERVGA